ncbi:putative WRKY transcription factor 3 [Carex rostrata]
MEHGNHGSGMRDHSDFSEFEQVPFMELLYSPPSVDDVEHHHNSNGSSWGLPASNYNFSHQKSSLNQFISPIPIPSSYAVACNYAPLNHLSSIPPPDQNQFNFETKLNILSPIENLTVEKPADDGYNWRKYGQKQLKDGKYPKSYYKCTSPSCPVKKTIERSSEGNITDITYQGQHNHGAVRQIESCEDGEEEIVVSKSDQERMSGSVDSDGLGNSEVIIDSTADSEIDKHSKDDSSGSSSSGNKKKEQKIIFETRSEVDLIDDGFRWRKYGQKSVKGNPHPRSYYKCTHLHCNVRKQIERASRDPKIVLTTYEGKHMHDPTPSARAISSHDAIQPTMVSEKTTNRLMNDAREHARYGSSA